MDRDRFLLVHGIDAQQWAKRYAIEPASAPCSLCGAELTTSIPFAFGGLRGLVAPTCSCGNVGTPYCLVSASPQADLLLSIDRAANPSQRPAPALERGKESG
jgi:hypothetical protein